MNDVRLTRIEDKIDKLGERLGSIDSTLASQHEQLVYHIKRTDLLETTLKPIERHVMMVHGALKLLGILALVGGIFEGMYALVELLGKIR